MSERGETARVLLVDDHSLMRLGLASAIAEDPRLTVCGEAGTAADALKMYRSLRPDIVLMDLRLPDASGAFAIAAIRGEFPEAKIVVISTFAPDEEIHAAVTAGARAYVLKTIDAPDLRAVVHAVLRGERHFAADVAVRLASRNLQSGLTVRERDVLELVARGKRNREIADALGITEGTVKSHVANILVKLGVTDRTEAATVAIERGIIRFG